MSEHNKNTARSGEEASAGTLPADPALEEALREAAESIEARHTDRESAEDAGASVGAESERPADRSGGEAGGDATELRELNEKYVRLAADFDNFRKRTLKEREEAHQFGHQNLVKDLLPTVDNLERAIAHAREMDEGGGLLEGVELVHRELEAALSKHGVAAIDPKGEPFDPALHEAMAQLPDGSVPPNTVIEVFQKGYQLRARLLRPARVVVSKLPDEGGDDSKPQEGSAQ
jgi:molecular chaperone GrpE